MNRPRYHILLIVLAGVLAYSNTFHASFHFDDNQNIIENPIIKDYSYFLEPSKAKGLRVYDLFRNRYLGYLTFALNYHLHGLDVVGYHIVNIAIHIFNSLLVYWLVILTFRTPFLRDKVRGVNPPLVALFSGLLFVSHPIQTQAVTYLVQRFASLATLFYLLSLVAYMRWRLISFPRSAPRMPAVAWYVVSLLSAVLAMKTKEIAFTLPVIIVLYEFMFFEGPVKKRLLFLVPLLLTMLIIPLSMISLDKPVGDIIGDVGEATRLKSSMSRWDYLFTQFRVIVTYLRLLILPINQNLDYDYPVFHSFFNREIVLSFLFLAWISAIGIYLVFKSRKTPMLRVIAFGIFWFFITLSVESSVIPISDIIFEHRLYFPSIGFGIAIVSAIFIAAENPLLNKIIVCLSAMVIILTSAAYMRNRTWQDEIHLWDNVVQNSPRKARGRCNLGDAYKDSGKTAQAVEQYRMALVLDPGYGEAESNMGTAFLSNNQLDRAIEHYRADLSMKPVTSMDEYYYTGVNINLGIAYLRKGLFKKAIEHFQSAQHINPDYAPTYYNLGNAYSGLGDADTARGYFLTAVKLDPGYVGAHIQLANMYFEQGALTDAKKECEAALLIDPDSQQAWQIIKQVHSSR